MNDRPIVYMTFTDGSFATVNLEMRVRNERVSANVRKAIGLAIPKVVDVAKNYAPVSPTQKELDDEYMRRRGRKNLAVRRKSVRFRERKNRPIPRGLERSIMGKEAEDGGYLFVASNAPAAKYAHYIHDMKGVLWRRRGIGTQRKGEQADWQFITRAIYDSSGRIHAMVKRAVEDALK